VPGSRGPAGGHTGLAVATVVGVAVVEVLVGVDVLVEEGSWPVCVAQAANARAAATSPMFLSLRSFMKKKARPVTFVRQRILGPYPGFNGLTGWSSAWGSSPGSLDAIVRFSVVR
jgi:hypothetical protein